MKRIATAALVLVAACVGGKEATPPPSTPNKVVLSRLPDPVDASSFVDATGDLLVPTPGGPCTPESLDEARRRYQRHLELYQDEDYESARIEFERAYALCGSAKLLYNLGHVERQLSNLSRAYVLLEAYLVKAEPTPERVAEVHKEMAEIEARTGWVAVECGPGVDHVIVDDRDLVALGACPFRRRVRVDRGKHRVRSEASETFTVEPRATVGVSLTLLAARR